MPNVLLVPLGELLKVLCKTVQQIFFFPPYQQEFPSRLFLGSKETLNTQMTFMCSRKHKNDLTLGMFLCCHFCRLL